jgi:hypothetical protein
MHCRKVRVIIQKYLDNELDKQRYMSVNNHLKTCVDCQNELKLLQQLIKKLDNIVKIEAPDDFTQKVMNNLPQRQQYKLIQKLKEIFDTFLLLPYPVPKLAMATATVTIAIALIILPVFVYHTRDTVKVNLYLILPNADTVAVVGDFNEWDVNKTMMHKNKKGIWHVELKLKPGNYQYMFLVNNEIWLSDPNATTYVNDGFGNKNAIIKIPYSRRYEKDEERKALL